MKHRRGAIFVVALGITVVLSAMLLIYAQQMRTESMSAAYCLSAAQADAVEQGAEQWAYAQIEANVPIQGQISAAATTAVDPTRIPAEALQVGGGYFWILHPDPTQDQLYGFGLVDESSKLNINSATPDQLINLPNMTQDIANNITTWAGTAGPNGVAITYETPDQLMMVDNMTEMTPLVLYGYDLNHDGVINNAERTASNGAAVTNGSTQDARGIYNFITTFSTTASPGSAGRTSPSRTAPQTVGLINVNTAPSQVLMCLPTMTASLAQTLISTRTSTVPTFGDSSWVSSALGPSTAQLIQQYITGLSYQYSADIVAVSGDGRAFKRVKIVIDCRTQPAKIVYRKDLTSLGWPLPSDVRTSLQQGRGVPSDVAGTSNTQTSGGEPN